MDTCDLQSWCEVPSIAHFCSLFRQAFDLLEFDIQELEESLLLMGTDDDSSKLVHRLLVRLLRGCSKSFTSNISEDNYNTYLRRLFLSKREEAEEDKVDFHVDCSLLVDEDVDFPDLPLRDRVLILRQLCEFRLDAEDVFDKLRNLEASSLRVEPLGTDSDGVTYWYFYGTRLYKETLPSKEHKYKKHSKDKDKKKKKKKDKKKKKKKRGESVSSADEEEASESLTYWSVACLTLQDWESLTEKYKRSKKKQDRVLFETLSDNFLPEIVKMFAEKEKEERKRLLVMQPKRASNRLELKRREQEEKDKEQAIKIEEERRIEEQYDEKLRIERETKAQEEQEVAREERARQRELAKELRAQRVSEREFKMALTKLKEQQREKRTNRSIKSLSDDDHSDDELRDRLYIPTKSGTDKGLDSASDDDMEGDVGDDEAKLRCLESKAKSTFTNALIKAGSKSTRDSLLEKPHRKSAGLLLETAGRSLLQKRNLTAEGTDAWMAAFGSSSSALSSSSKISFGLYEGHLPIDHSNYTKSSDENESDSDRKDTSDSYSQQHHSYPAPDDAPMADAKKVFSNWGGEFFKRNLNFRANTNKILEKMNLSGNKSHNGVRCQSSLSAPGSKRPATAVLDSSPEANAKELKASHP